jgi:hypothetical protein
MSHPPSGGLAVIRVTILPMNTGMVESSSATSKPAANSAANKTFGLAGKMPEERAKIGRRFRPFGYGGRLEQPLEQRKHRTSSQRASSADGALRRAMRPLIRIYGIGGAG